MIKCIRGVYFAPVATHVDDRGELGTLEAGPALGFEIRRIFYIKPRMDVVRAEHASSGTQAIIDLAGAVTVDLDNGRDRQTVALTDPSIALCIQPGVWRKLSGFHPGTVLLVAASDLISEAVYYDAPRPELIPDNGPS